MAYNLEPTVIYAAKSLAASFNSDVIDCRYLDWLSLTLSWGAGHTASTIKIEGSDDPQVGVDAQTGTNTAIWVPRTYPDGGTDSNGEVSVAGKTATMTANAGKFQICLEGLPAYIRFVYGFVAGSGTLRASISGTGK